VNRQARFFLVMLIINACLAIQAAVTGPPYFWFWLEVITCGWLIYMIGVEVYMEWWSRHREGVPPTS